MAFHWIMAMAILFMIGLGLYMTRLPPGNEQFVLYQLHKSIGITVLLAAVLRIVWRLANPVPRLPASMKPWERWLARFSHYGLYVLMLGTPLLGWAVVSSSPLNVPTVLYGSIPWPHLPVLAELQNKEAVSNVLAEWHEVAAFAILFLFLLHVAGALKHHFIERDDTLRRMLPVTLKETTVKEESE